MISLKSSLLLLLFLCACNSTEKFSFNSPTKLPLSIATTRTWEETGAMCVLDNGDIYCWGSSGFAVDEAQNLAEVTPTKVSKLSGGAHGVSLYNTRATCAIGSAGSLRCASAIANPTNVLFSSGVTKVEVNTHSACAIVNGSLKCWGYNGAGILGDGTFVDSTNPVDVVGMSSGVTDVSVGLNTACAIKDGAAYCWGSNEAGSIGNGTTTGSAIPVLIPSLSSGVTDISTTYGSYGETGDSSYAIKDGALYAWGQNDWGQLGDGTTVDKLSPTLLTPFSSGVTQVDGGGIETCFLQNNDVYCFGLNENAQMGIVADSQRYAPQKINGISGVVKQVAAGSRRGCAATEDKVYCWGMNGDNVIDSSNTNDQPVPKVVYIRK